MRRQLNGNIRYIVCLNYTQAPLGIHPDIQQVLDRYQSIFALSPASPPPNWGFYYTIELQSLHEPISLRPYRNSYFQKNEIKKIMRELLDMGIIQPSKSPYAAPIVLVRKKDGSFWLCVDYRALNKITIKNKFPTPRINDMLDKIHGAAIFTKLDL